MRLEYREPHRSDYATETEWCEACINATLEYQRATFRAIDSAILPAKMRTEKPRVAEKSTVHDYLQAHPVLLRRYKEIGPLALLELEQRITQAAKPDIAVLRPRFRFEGEYMPPDMHYLDQEYLSQCLEHQLYALAAEIMVSWYLQAHATRLARKLSGSHTF